MSDLEADLKEYASANGATKTKALVEKILAGGEAGPISPGSRPNRAHFSGVVHAPHQLAP